MPKASDYSRKFVRAPRYMFRKLNIMRFIDRQSDIQTFIDVGCGAGELASSLVETHSMKGIGTDFSKAAILVAKSIRDDRGINPNKLVFIEGDAFAQIKDPADLVICCEVLEHIEDDEFFLKQLIRLSKQYLIIAVPAKQKLFDSSDAAVGHYRRYDKSDLIKLLEKNNLAIEEFVSYGYPFTNIIRILRKSAFALKLKKNKTDSPEDRSKESGINPVKIPLLVRILDKDIFYKPLFWISLLFNGFNLAEGYVVFCKKQSIK